LQLPTCNIAKKGFCGMRSSSPASISLYFDSDVLRIPFLAILPSLWAVQKKNEETVTEEEFYSKTEAKLRALGRANSTISLYISALKKFVTFCGDKQLESINTTDFEKFAKQILLKKLKPGTSNALKFGINFGFNEVLKSEIDISALPSFQNPLLRKEYFEKKELLQFFSVIENLKHRTIMEFMYSAGLDLENLINIKITDISSKKTTITIRKDNGEIIREAYLSPQILDRLRNYVVIYLPKTYLFEGNKESSKYSTSSIQNIFKKSLKESGINKQLTTISLKTSYIKHLTEDGIPINIILNNLKIDNSSTIKSYMDLCYPKKKYNLSPFDTLSIEYEDFEFFDTTELERLLTKVTDEQERDYLLEGIKCFKAHALRAGVIFLWTAAIYKIQKKCIVVNSGYLNTELKKIYPKAKDIRVLEDFEYIKDEFLLDLACNIKVLDKTTKEELKNTCLDLRNRCSHPGNYKPKAQKIKAYVEDIIGMLYD